MTPLQESSAALHEFYLSLKEAGFKEKQALYLTGQMVAGAQRRG